MNQLRGRLQAARVLEATPSGPEPDNGYLKPQFRETPAPAWTSEIMVEAEAVDRLAPGIRTNGEFSSGDGEFVTQRQRVPVVLRNERHRAVDPALREQELRRQAYELWSQQQTRSSLQGHDSDVDRLLGQIRELVEALSSQPFDPAGNPMKPDEYRTGKRLLDQYSEISRRARDLLQEYLTPADIADLSPAEVIIRPPPQAELQYLDPDSEYSQRVFDRHRRWADSGSQDGGDLRVVNGGGAAEFVGPEYGPLKNARPVRIVDGLRS